jgi:hypothetical protein
VSIQVSGTRVSIQARKVATRLQVSWNFSLDLLYAYIYIVLRMAEEPRQVEAGPSSQLPSGFEKWRTSLSQFTGLGLTDEQRVEREADKANGVLARDWDRCEKWKKELLERSTSSSLVLYDS